MTPISRPAVNYEFYECTGRTHGCKTGAVRRRDVDEAVFAYFQQIILDVEATKEQMRVAGERKLREVEALLAAAEQEAQEAARQLDRVRRDYTNGDLTAAEWRECKNELEPDLSAATAQADQLREQVEAIRSQTLLGEAEQEVAEQLTKLRSAIAGDVTAADDLDAVRAVLRRLFDCFLFHKDRPDEAHVELIGENYWIEPVVSERAIAGYDEDQRPIIEPQPLEQAEKKYKQPSGWLYLQRRRASEALGAGITPKRSAARCSQSRSRVTASSSQTTRLAISCLWGSMAS